MMSGFQEKNGVLHCDDVSLESLAQEYGTPLYVYSASVIKDQFDNLTSAMARALPKGKQPLLCFACKSNGNLSVLSHLKSLGSGLEIVSEGELVRGLRAGFQGNQIVSTGVGKQDSEIAACLKASILQLNVESLPELERIQKIASDLGMKANVAFRLNPNVSGGGHHKISTGRKGDKFGMGVEMMEQAYAMATSMSHVNPVGLSMHIGSQVFEVQKFKEAFSHIPEVVKNLRAIGHTVSRLDIGGGFPIVYKDEKLLDLDSYAQWVNDIIAPLDTDIILEPGRYLVGNAGVIVTKVLYVKEAASKKFLIIDAAMNDLIRPAMYDAYHGIEALANRNAAKEIYDVVGPICETGDTFTTDRELPQMSQGDLAVIKSAGAYGSAMASNYNTRPISAEIMVKDGAAKLVRRRQTFDDILEFEMV